MENTDHLANWSRLENGITLNALKRAAYTSMLARGPQVESFATWLMAGAGATAGLLVANIGSVTDAIGRGGVQWVLYSLTASIFFGLASKAFAVFIPSNAAQIADARASIAAVLERHGAKRKEIEAMAQKMG